MLLGVSDDRAHRWRRRRADDGALEDRRPGGVAFHALRPGEVEAILADAACGFEPNRQRGGPDSGHRRNNAGWAAGRASPPVPR